MDADSAASLEGDPGRERVRDDLEVAAFHRRAQIGVGGRPAHAVPHRHVEGAKPLLPLAVEVGADRIAGLTARLDEGVVERVAFEAARRRERPAVAAIGVGAAAKALGAAEVGQHVSISPALRALLFPALEIERMPAHIDEAVDRGRAAQNLAARAVHAPAVEMRLGLAAIAPIVGLRVHRDRERRRHLDEGETGRIRRIRAQGRSIGGPRSAGRRARSPRSPRRRSRNRKPHRSPLLLAFNLSTPRACAPADNEAASAMLLGRYRKKTRSAVKDLMLARPGGPEPALSQCQPTREVVGQAADHRR